MKTKKPATHTGTVTYIPPGNKPAKSYTVQLVEHKATYEDKATGNRYTKRHGARSPYSAWARLFLDLSSVKPIQPEA